MRPSTRHVRALQPAPTARRLILSWETFAPSSVCLRLPFRLRVRSPYTRVMVKTWLRRLLRVTRRDKMRNETVRCIPCQETTLVDRIAERRLNWFGHVSRMGSERLPAKALHCYINVKRNQGRQPKKWVDNVKEDIEAKKCTTSNGSVVRQKQMETSSSSLIISEMMEESRRDTWDRQTDGRTSKTHYAACRTTA